MVHSVNYPIKQFLEEEAPRYDVLNLFSNNKIGNNPILGKCKRSIR